MSAINIKKQNGFQALPYILPDMSCYPFLLFAQRDQQVKVHILKERWSIRISAIDFVMKRKYNEYQDTTTSEE